MSARNPQQNAELNISYKAPDTEKEKCQSSYACRMDAVREQLQKLNSEMADLTGKVETARDNWLKAPDARQEAKLEKVCEDLKKKEELLDTRIAKLEDKLPSSGEHTVQIAFARLSMVGVSACMLERKVFCTPKTFLEWKQKRKPTFTAARSAAQASSSGEHMEGPVFAASPSQTLPVVGLNASPVPDGLPQAYKGSLCQ